MQQLTNLSKEEEILEEKLYHKIVAIIKENNNLIFFKYDCHSPIYTINIDNIHIKCLHVRGSLNFYFLTYKQFGISVDLLKYAEKVYNLIDKIQQNKNKTEIEQEKAKKNNQRLENLRQLMQKIK